MTIRRLEVICLVFILAFSLAQVFFYRNYYPLGFDEAWHIFILAQASWKEFFAQLRFIAHPPVYFLLAKILRLPLEELGGVFLLSLCFALASSVLFYRIVALLTDDKLTRLVCAAFFINSSPHLGAAFAVRNYSICLCLILLSLYLFLREMQQGSVKLTWVVVVALLALATNFGAGVAYCGLTAALMLVLALKKDFRSWATKVLRANAPVLALSGVIVALILTYKMQFSHATAAQMPYLKRYVFQAGQGLGEFYRGAMANLIWDFLGLSLAKWGVVVLSLCALLGLLSVLWFGRQARSDILLMIFAPYCIGAVTFLLALFRFYPFGGPQRQQYFFFTFFALSIAAVITLISHPWMRRMLCALVLVLLTVVVRNERTFGGSFWRPFTPVPREGQEICGEQLPIKNFYAAMNDVEIFAAGSFFLDYQTKLNAPSAPVKIYQLQLPQCAKPVLWGLVLSYQPLDISSAPFQALFSSLAARYPSRQISYSQQGATGMQSYQVN